MRRLLGMGILPVLLAFNLYSGPLLEQAPPPGSVAATAPAEVVYGIFLKELVAFQKKADDLEAQGKSGISFRTRHQEVTELSTRQFVTVRDVATSCVQDVQSYDEQAAAIIKGVRNSVKAAGPGSRVPPIPQELLDLEQKRIARILAAVEKIRTALGPGAFLYFDMRVRGHLAPNLSLARPAAVPPTSDSTGAPK